MEQTHEKMMKLVMDLAEQVMQHDESLSTMMEKLMRCLEIQP